MRYIGSLVAGGMALMCVVTVGLVLHVDRLADKGEAQALTIDVLLAVVVEQNRTIEALGGTPIPLPAEVRNQPTPPPSPQATQPPPSAPPSSAGSTTTASTVASSTTGSTTTEPPLITVPSIPLEPIQSGGFGTDLRLAVVVTLIVAMWSGEWWCWHLSRSRKNGE